MCQPVIITHLSTLAASSANPESQILGLPIDLLLNLVKVGEFGSAVAMLILGFYLYWRASNSQLPDIPARKAVAKQFMFFAGGFFIVCCLVELAKPLMPEPHPKINAMVAVPPLSEGNYTRYGQIDIVGLDSFKQQPDVKHAHSVPQYFIVHENSTITIDLSSLVAQLDDAKRKIDDSIAKTAHAGPATEPK